MKKINGVFLFAFFLISVFTFPSIAEACSCERPPGVEVEASRSKAVFAGTVLNIQEKTPLFGAPTKTVLFEVEETWKGVKKSQIMVGIGSGGGDCGSVFQEGTAYLVYAREPSLYSGSHEFEALVCSRTNELATAQEDLAVLGTGALPAERVDLASQENRQGVVWLLAAFLAASAPLAFILVKRKKR